MKKAQPPKAPPPLSSDEMAVIKKKVAPPKGPPPVGLANFKAPKKYNENENDDYQRNNNNNNDDDDIEIDNNNNHHQNSHRYNNTNNNTNNNNNNTKGRYSNNVEYEYDDDNNCYDHDNLISNLNNNSNSNNNKNFNYQSDSKQNNRNNNNSKNKGRNDNFHDDDDDGGNNNHNNDDEYENDYGDNSGNINGNNNHNNYSNPKSKRDHDYDDDNNNNSKKKNHDQSNLESKSLPPLDPHPLKPRVFNFRKILRASFKELKSFVTTPCDPNTIIRCYIERSRSGSNFLTPVYSLCADLEDGTGRELIACRKMLKSKTSYYVFSLKSEDLFRKREQRGKYYLGKLRAMSDNRYVLYDSGVCDTIRSNDTQNDTVDDISIDGDDEGHSSNSSPQRRQQHLQQQLQLQQQHHDDDNSLYRSQLAIIHYNSKVRPVNEGERGMEICIPHLVNGSDTSALRHVDMIPNFDKIQLVGKQNELFANKYTILHEKRSRYDPLSSCLVDFQGRATVASVKNFQLVMSTPMIDNPSSRIRAPMIAWSNNNEGNQEEVIFQMGKITGECFNMDFRSPLTMLQAFAIAVSRFDANLTW